MSAHKKTSPERPKRILIVDDDPAQVAQLGYLLEQSHPDMERLVATTGAEALAFLSGSKARSLALVLLDLGLPDMSGLRVLTQARQLFPELPVAVLTFATDVTTVVSSMRAGASDYLAKPLEEGQLAAAVSKALSSLTVAAAGRAGKRAGAAPPGPGRSAFPDLIGASPVMQTLFRHMGRVAPRDVTVLVQGESGTGKELVARALHKASPRSERPFVAINCAAIPETLQESELFGHERGAFTGANQRHPGRFEQADGGTLFLDEIGEISPSLQAKLLRAIQERRFHRVGGAVEVRVDVRIIAATHRDLMREVAAQRFREDLYYRLAVFELGVPPLRERGDDVLAIAEALLDDLAQRHGLDPITLAPEAEDALLAYDWPGNVRELQNALERAIVLASDQVIRREDLPPRLAFPSPRPEVVPENRGATTPSVGAAPTNMAPAQMAPAAAAPMPPRRAAETVADVERRMIAEALELTGGNVSEVCRQLGIPRTSMYRKLRSYGFAIGGGD